MNGTSFDGWLGKDINQPMPSKMMVLPPEPIGNVFEELVESIPPKKLVGTEVKEDKEKKKNMVGTGRGGEQL